MIPIGELRVGNIVELYGTIATIQRSDFDINGVGIAIDKGKPIELNDELLIRAGFERTTRISDLSQTPVWANYSFTLTIWDDGRLFYDWIGGNIEVKSVHHLQNIYRDLLKEELKIK